MFQRVHNAQKNCRIAYVRVSGKFDYKNAQTQEKNGEIPEERTRNR